VSIVQLTCKISKFIESVDQINFSRSIFGRSEAVDQINFARSIFGRSEVACDATSMQQSAEWGVHTFQSVMPCLKDRMKFEECGEQKVTLKIMNLLYNL